MVVKKLNRTQKCRDLEEAQFYFTKFLNQQLEVELLCDPTSSERHYLLINLESVDDSDEDVTLLSEISMARLEFETLGECNLKAEEFVNFGIKC